MLNEKAILAAGCFWGVQAVFDQVPGVIKTVVGYSGGKTKNPTYEQVCSKLTGHAESVEVEFNPKIISYDKLIDIFFMNHDPTTLNKQGPDVGSQYRSAIFYLNDRQRREALKSKIKWQPKFKNPIVTEIEPAREFYKAEDYHQKYYKTHKISCHINLS